MQADRTVYARRSAVLTWIATLCICSAALADPNDNGEKAAHDTKTAGIVLLSVAGSLEVAAIGVGGASYYYDIGNHWTQPGRADTGPSFATISLSMSAAALGLVLIGTPLAIAGSAREKRARVQASVAPTAIALRF